MQGSDLAQHRRVAIPFALSPAALFRPGGELCRLDGETMGTSWCVTFVGSSRMLPSVRIAITQVLDRVNARFSPWQPASELNRFNTSQPGTWHVASADFAEVTACALRTADETGGACDPALGALVDLWGFGPHPRRGDVPPAAAIEDALRASGWRHIVQDRNTISRKTKARLDFCGIAKGYAVDLVAQSLRQSGIPAALVEIGGELSGFGIKPDGTPWWVAVDGGAPDDTPILVALHGLAIATSGCERGFTHADTTYSHTIDPRTGYPVANGVISATVLHESCMQADACATALMVLGTEDAITFADRHALAAVIRHRSGERISKAMQAMLDG
jgi:thiamine biosynthesis lipoprotein